MRILFDRYWSASGWKSGDERSIAPKDFTYAKGAGVMFDPVSLSHHDIVQRAIVARDALTPEAVADGFLASLSTRGLHLRSALGSYAVLHLFPQHGFSAQGKQCAVCGVYEDKRPQPQDLNVLSFERFKWGGVRHDQPIYAAFDLEQFVGLDRPRPSADDVELFQKLLGIIEAVPPATSAAMLSKHLASAGLRSNKAERDVVIGILGLCGILGTAAHPGYVEQFVPYSEREFPLRRFGICPIPPAGGSEAMGSTEKLSGCTLATSCELPLVKEAIITGESSGLPYKTFNRCRIARFLQHGDVSHSFGPRYSGCAGWCTATPVLQFWPRQVYPAHRDLRGWSARRS